jgi:hypothetical protein
MSAGAMAPPSHPEWEDWMNKMASQKVGAGDLSIMRVFSRIAKIATVPQVPYLT